jgi:hypothetical protein
MYKLSHYTNVSTECDDESRCLMLDFDDGSQGAADLQVQTGPIRTELGSELFSFALDEAVKKNLKRLDYTCDII